VIRQGFRPKSRAPPAGRKPPPLVPERGPLHGLHDTRGASRKGGEGAPPRSSCGGAHRSAAALVRLMRVRVRAGPQGGRNGMAGTPCAAGPPRSATSGVEMEKSRSRRLAPESGPAAHRGRRRDTPVPTDEMAPASAPTPNEGPATTLGRDERSHFGAGRLRLPDAGNYKTATPNTLSSQTQGTRGKNKGRKK